VASCNGIEVGQPREKGGRRSSSKPFRQDWRRLLELRQQLAKSSVKKYQTMQRAVCDDVRARGMFAFYGANRTGPLGRSSHPAAEPAAEPSGGPGSARALVKSGDFEAVKMLYEDVPDTLSQLIRTAFIPKDGMLFYVADFSAIEARVIAWYAGEKWRQKVFEDGGDIYCASASQMFHVPVVKHGVNGDLRAERQDRGARARLRRLNRGSQGDGRARDGPVRGRASSLVDAWRHDEPAAS
jgi:DNA polymerase bacteriophage-type